MSLMKAIPAALGLGIAWIGINLVKNEKRLLLRKLELEKIIHTKSKKLQKKLILDA